MEIDPLDFLKAVMINAELPLMVRMRAAIEMRIHRFEQMKLIENNKRKAEVANRSAEIKGPNGGNGGQVEMKRPLPRIAFDKRFRRM